MNFPLFVDLNPFPGNDRNSSWRSRPCSSPGSFGAFFKEPASQIDTLTLMQFLIAKMKLCWRPQVEELYYSKVFAVCFFLSLNYSFIMVLYTGYRLRDTVEEVGGGAQQWSMLGSPTLEGHLSAVPLRSLLNPKWLQDRPESPLKVRSVPASLERFLFGHTIVAKLLKYLWDFWSLWYRRLPNT